MANQTGGPSQPRTGPADQAAEQMLKRVLSLTPWGIMHHATKHVAAAVTFTHKLSQAADLQDRMKIHAEHAKMHVDLMNDRAKELSDIMAVAGNIIGAIVQQLHVYKNLTDMARKASTQQPTGRQASPQQPTGGQPHKPGPTRTP